MKQRETHRLHPILSALRPGPRALILAILLLALALRCYRLDAQSFWNDEGNSARIAERSLHLILEGARGDIHPPGYYLLLYYWRALVGQSEFALRALSVVAGLILVLFTYLLGRRLFGAVTGLTAALLGAVSPFAIYYSQEARMYALLAALSAASTCLLVRVIAGRQQLSGSPQTPSSQRFSLGAGVGYVVVSAGGLYTHYAFPFVLFAHNGIFGLWWLAVARKSSYRWRWLALWAVMQGAVVLPYLPWLRTALASVRGWASAGSALELGPALLDTLRVLTVGLTLPAEEAGVVLVGAGLLLPLGLWPARSSRNRLSNVKRVHWLGVASLGIYLLLPIALIFALDLFKPAWLKFMLVVAPSFHVILARGICRVQIPGFRRGGTGGRLAAAIRSLHPASIVLLVAYLVATFPSLHNLYFNPAYARDDYRRVAADIAADARSGDGIVLNAPNQWEVFTYYYPDRDVYPTPYRPGPDEAEAFVASLIERYRRLFVLYWGDAESDPQRLIESGLSSHAYKASDEWYGNVRLATYGVAALPEEPVVTVDAGFGESIRLRGYAVEEDAFEPGGILPVTLFWQSLASVPERYKITLQVLDGEGQLVAQHDSEPGDGLMSTIGWEAGQVVVDRCGIPLPSGLAHGRYTLVVGLYHIATGERLSIDLGGEPAGDQFPLQSIRFAQ
jgi:4-amino-4-deoxy-L-arabinose transferase-like glycosyltransferase